MKRVMGVFLAIILLVVGFQMLPEFKAVNDYFYTNVAVVIDPNMSPITHTMFQAGGLIMLGLVLYAAYAAVKGKRQSNG
jgi:hypothetical protein